MPETNAPAARCQPTEARVRVGTPARTEYTMTTAWWLKGVQMSEHGERHPSVDDGGQRGILSERLTRRRVLALGAQGAVSLGAGSATSRMWLKRYASTHHNVRRSEAAPRWHADRGDDHRRQLLRH